MPYNFNKTNLNSDNILQLTVTGRLEGIKEYSAGRAAFVTVAVDRVDKSGNTHTDYIQFHSFNQACYNTMNAGQKVRVYGHVYPSKYEKNGQMVYAQDLVADRVEILGIKSNVDAGSKLQLTGQIAGIKEYSAGRAAFVTVTVDRVDENSNKHTNYIKLKSFAPACYNTMNAGQKVRVYGHVKPSKYEKNGQMVYVQDLVADRVEFLGQRFRSRDRETAYSYSRPANAGGTTYRNPMRGTGRGQCF